MTEQAIIQGCQQKQEQAQRELVLRYSAMLLTVSRRYCRDDASARDNLQESLIKILQGISSYRPRGSFEAWMRRIVINNALQSHSRFYFKNELNGFEHLPERIIPPKIYADLAAEELMELVHALPPGFRQVFNLYVIEGYSHEEIGELMKISASTSRSQLARARKMLQQLFYQKEKIRV